MNNFEKEIFSILEKLYPNKFKDNTKGKIFKIGEYMPDFIDKDHKEIVEAYGCYYHCCKKCNLKRNYESTKYDNYRASIMKLLNYKMLIIWEHELNSYKRVESKIIKFVEVNK